MVRLSKQPVLKSNRLNGASRCRPSTHVATRIDPQQALALMPILLVLVGDLIMLQHLAFSGNSWLVLAGLGWVLRGLCDATTWR